MKYKVRIPECHIATIYVNAKNEEEAMEKAEMEYAITGEPDELEFSHAVAKCSWEAIKVKSK